MPASHKTEPIPFADAPVALHDLMPTFLEAGGVPIPETVEGRSLLPLVSGAAADPAWREWVHMELLSQPFGFWHCVTDGREKYVWDSVSGKELFFNLVDDPRECRNLANDPAAADPIVRWRERLVIEIADYEKFGLVKNGKLNPGHRVPNTEDWVLEGTS